MAEPKILIFDLETIPDLKEVMRVFPGLSDYPGRTLKASMNSVICFGYQVFGEHEDPKCMSAWDYPAWDNDINDDRDLVMEAREIIASADAVVTHNGKRFDWKFFQTRLMKWGLPPLHKINHIDTCVLARQHLHLFNNKLDTLGQFLVDDKKMDHEGWNLWVRVLNKDRDALRKMVEYCKQDVRLLGKVFKKMRPFITNMPNYNIEREIEQVLCPVCGSTRVKKDGVRYVISGRVQKYFCNDCYSHSSAGKRNIEPKTF